MMHHQPSIISRRLNASQRPYESESENSKSTDKNDYYYDGVESITEFINCLSLLFPEGEAFFVRSVAAFAKDPRVL